MHGSPRQHWAWQCAAGTASDGRARFGTARREQLGRGRHGPTRWVTAGLRLIRHGKAGMRVYVSEAGFRYISYEQEEDVEQQRVRLTDDLTKYDARCTVGAEGTTGSPVDIWARQFPGRFVGVYFDSGARLDVLWSGLEVLDAPLNAGS